MRTHTHTRAFQQVMISLMVMQIWGPPTNKAKRASARKLLPAATGKRITSILVMLSCWTAESYRLLDWMLKKLSRITAFGEIRVVIRCLSSSNFQPPYFQLPDPRIFNITENQNSKSIKTGKADAGNDGESSNDRFNFRKRGISCRKHNVELLVFSYYVMRNLNMFRESSS